MTSPTLAPLTYATDLSALRPLYDEAGPFVTVQVDVISAVLDTDRRPGRHARLLVAANGRLLLDEVLPDSTERDFACSAALPHCYKCYGKAPVSVTS